MAFFDLDQVRAIPIRDVALRLGLPVDEKGRTDCLVHWGATGTERASCTLDAPGNRFFCPCGNAGWTTDLVTQARKWDIVEAIRWLGTEFGLQPVRTPKKTDYVSRSRGLK